MSLLKKLKKGISKASSAINKAGPLASFIPGGSLIQAASKYTALIPKSSPRAAAAPAAFQMQPVSFGGGSGMGVAPRSMGSLPAAGRVLSTLGARVNYGRLWRAVKVLGIGAVATALNIEVGQLAADLLAHPAKRRRKGITARQLANARRTNRIVLNWSKQLTCTTRSKRR